ncbi:hypothetical protein ACIGBL_07270 [Streptomyces sp. NPDC085614]|uniref:hypothetical protein n=1 Tax=Streptomyces sp. NPDC085614 TaxID=3365733 RepID=UPI0037D1B54E
MISDPELVDGGGLSEARTPSAVIDPVPPKPPRPVRPWLWAVGGAVVASALWGGGLYAHERYEAGRGVDLGGYRSVGDVCAKAELKALSGELGEVSRDGNGSRQEDPALERATCSAIIGSPDTGFSVDVYYELHKVTDPGPEFEARLGDLRTEAERVDGLGEVAYFDRDENDLGAWIRVLDGQVEIEISLQRLQNWDGEKNEAVPQAKTIDLSGVDALLAQDMKALMAALRQG